MPVQERVLVVNAGSSSLKMQLLPGGAAAMVERIGSPPGILVLQGEPAIEFPSGVPDHTRAFQLALEALERVVPEGRIAACGHRVVHGGEAYSAPVLIDDDVLAELERLSRLAPLHNPAGIAGIRAALATLPGVPQVAVFDTAFHATLPPRAFLTGLPRSYYEQRGIRNYGFHGTNHDWVTRRGADVMGRPREELKMVSLHLGNGSSACAVDRGRSIDSSMGFTPLAGLLMGTRPGDLDPGVILYLLEEGMELGELTHLLNRESGLKGLSGVSHDMRDVRAAARAGNADALQALEVYSYRIRKAVGTCAAAMEGLDAIVFTGGIGENDAQLREEVLTGLAWLGATLDEGANLAAGPVITTGDSRVTALVVPADEAAMIAAQTAELTGVTA